MTSLTLPTPLPVDGKSKTLSNNLRGLTRLNGKRKCLWCNERIYGKHRQSKFCCNSHRVMNHKKQAMMLVKAFSQFAGISYFDAGIVKETVGTSYMKLFMYRVGFIYDYRNRIWRQP